MTQAAELAGYASSLPQFRNRIINGHLKSAKVIKQRGISTITGATGYTYDRWYYDGSTYLYQGIEDANVENGTYVISWEGSGISAEYLLSTDTTGGTITSQTFSSALNSGDTFTVSGTEFSNHLWIRFSGTLSNLDKVQVELGTVATPFEHRPIGVELSLCHRYFEICHFNVYGYVQGNTYQTGTNVSWQPKRATPTATYTGTRDGGGNNYTGTNGGNIAHIKNSSALLNAQGAASGVSYLVGAKWEISAEL